MDTMIRQSVRPKQSKLTYYLLALVILGFGAFAEHYSSESAPQIPQAVQAAAINK